MRTLAATVGVFLIIGVSTAGAEPIRVTDPERFILQTQHPIHLTSGHDVWALPYLSTASVHVWAYGGDDRVRAAGGRDTLEGMYGADILEGRGNNDHLIGGPGPDILVGGLGYDKCVGGRGLDQFLGCEVVYQ